MTIEVIEDDLFRICNKVTDDLVCKIGIEYARFHRDHLFFSRERMLIIKVYIPGALWLQLIFYYDLSRSAQRRMIFSEKVHHPVTVAAAQSQHLIVIDLILEA